MSGLAAAPIPLAPGLVLHKGRLDGAAQADIVEAIRVIARAAPFFTPAMPGTGKPFSVRMTNCGPLGWVSDASGYRYQPTHPETGEPWPPIPARLIDLWNEAAAYPHPPEACLVNHYDPEARMGLHQDKDEADLAAPVLSVSLGDPCTFRFGGADRRDPTRSVRLESGDVVILGGASRLAFHGVDRIFAGRSTLLRRPGRINLTLRRVTLPPAPRPPAG
jgi:alkylated DNA repair protein (DNA oxidative demethylase)